MPSPPLLTCPGSLEAGHDDNVRKHAQLGPQGGVPGPQDLDAAAHTSDGQWVSTLSSENALILCSLISDLRTECWPPKLFNYIFVGFCV